VNFGTTLVIIKGGEIHISQKTAHDWCWWGRGVSSSAIP